MTCIVAPPFRLYEHYRPSPSESRSYTRPVLAIDGGMVTHADVIPPDTAAAFEDARSLGDSPAPISLGLPRRRPHDVLRELDKHRAASPSWQPSGCAARRVRPPPLISFMAQKLRGWGVAPNQHPRQHRFANPVEPLGNDSTELRAPYAWHGGCSMIEFSACLSVRSDRGRVIPCA